MNPSLVRLKSFGSTMEADAARMALEHEGIRAFLDGASAASVMNHVGTALGGVRLMVSSDDAVRAGQILDDLAEEAERNKAPWYCSACSEDVDASFDLCWSCGRSRAEVEIPRPASKFSFRQEEKYEDEIDVESDDDFDDDPFDESDFEEEDSDQAAMEAMITRAWRASIIGTFFLPVVLHLYSMWLLLRVSARGHEFSDKASRRYYQAFAINIIAGGAWGIIFVSL